MRAISASLGRWGQQKPIVIDKNGRVVAGNGTLAAAIALGWTKIDIVQTDLAGVEAVAYGIADNRTSELAEWEDDGLARLLNEFRRDGDFDISALGFEPDDVDRLIGRALGINEALDSPVPEPPDEAVTQPGDLIVLGVHRLLCGDSSLATDVDRLLDGQPVHLVNTDPPYNVKVEPRSNNAIAAGKGSMGGHDVFDPDGNRHRARYHSFDLATGAQSGKATHKKMRAKDRSLSSDFVSDEAFEQMLHAWFGNIARVLLPGRGFYIWGGYASIGNYSSPLKACELYFSQAIIWHKQWPVLTRKDFLGDHEWCFYGWREGAAHVFLGPNNVGDVWSIRKVTPNSMIHLTEKPVELAVRAIQYSSRSGENVLDLFGGSGSTLIAAEQTGRRAFLMEIDALYCDVIVTRWEQFTGRKAERPSRGEV